MMEKTLAADGPEIPYTQRKRRILVRLVLAILLLVSLLRISGVFIDAFPLNRFFGHPHSSCRHHNTPTPSTQDFQLVSIHRAGVGKSRNQVYQILNIPPSSIQDTSSPFHHEKLSLSSVQKQTTRLAHQSRHHITEYLTRSRLYKQSLRDRLSVPLSAPTAEWVKHDIPAPNISHKDTVTRLAKVASNAYIRIPETEDWYDIGKHWNESNDFGWEEHGLRGHVFANKDNSTIIVAMKGTSPPFVGGSDTATNDKINDNILFSCCCARVSYIWSTVCDCFTGDTYKCNLTCLENEVVSENHYYHTALSIYYNVTATYPNSTMWLTGHSLGGALASLIGLTFGVPVVTFEAPPERLAAQRLHLPGPPALKPEDMLIWHFGHTADPIYMGVCTGPTSPCWYAGYAMESTCHTGFECIYDSVTDLGWRVSLSNHRIKPVINDLLERYNETATCGIVEDCVDCYEWDWVD